MQFRRAGDFHPAMPHLTAYDLDSEWLEADGSGGFACGTVAGARTRRYHGLLSPATTPPTGRMVLVNGVEAWVDGPDWSAPLSTQAYAPDVVFPDARGSLLGFDRLPWPSWIFALRDGTIVAHEIFVQPASCETVLRWRRTKGSGPCRLRVRPLLSGRDYHALHRENATFRFDAAVSGGNVCWRPYGDVPAVTAMTNGAYDHAPVWYRNFLYAEERARGLGCLEDLASPGVFAFDLSEGDTATIVLRTGDGLTGEAGAYGRALAASERARRSACESGTQLAAKSYVVARGSGRTLIAGFPWFTDWGRDTFIAMRGLVLRDGWLGTAEDILRAWAGCVSGGMLPNRFPDAAGAPEYNAVDASLWYVVAVHEFLACCEASGVTVRAAVGDALRGACEAILAGYMAGTRFGIVAAGDGLLQAGVDGVQLTWMDAKTGDRVVTPRTGKPVEVQALWVNALRIGGLRWDARWRAAAERAQDSFAERFSCPAGGLLDVVDVGHVAGARDASVRPNQIFAVGGLPFALLEGAPAREVVDVVERALLTPLGLRTLAPDDPDYVGRYEGGPAARDGAYHQGTAWPWLMGAFVDAWLAVRGRSTAAKAEATTRFLDPLMAHLDHAGLGHVSEIVDGDAPHTPRGCPFQAWSLGELMRIRAMLDLDMLDLEE